MSSDATTLPLPDTLLERPRSPHRHGLSGERADAREASRRQVVTAALALGAIVFFCALIVVLAADRPSLLSATTHAHFFPGWMAGPLGGLLPQFPRSATALRDLFSCAMVAMYTSWLLALRYVPLLRARWVIGAVLAVNAVLLLSPPLSLTDVFNYINYARMEIVHHLNPYVTTPVLEPHSDPSYYLSNWHQLLSPYGQLFTLVTFALVPLGVAGSFWGMKCILVASSLTIALLVWRMAKLLGRDPLQALVFAGLNPIVLVWGLAGDHNDFLMVLCVVLGFYLLLGAEASDRAGADAISSRLPYGLDRRDILAGAAVIAGVAIKASGAIFIPILLASVLYSKRRFAGVLVGVLLGAVIFGAASFLAFGPNLPDLGAQGSIVTAMSPPNLLGLALGQGGATQTLRALITVGLVASVGGCCLLAWRRRDPVTAAGWAAFALIVSLSWVLPWYVLWVLPLAAVSSSRRLRGATLILGAYLILTWAPLFSSALNAIGFHPSKTPLGALHQRQVKELLH
jgi:alpha-1,6-mannosyltransferase